MSAFADVLLVPWGVEHLSGDELLPTGARDVFERGSFQKFLQDRKKALPLTLGHGGETVGTIEELRERADGLWARLFVADDSAAERLLSGALTVSIGAIAPPRGKHFDEAESLRRISEASADHVALVPEAGIPGARVLECKSAEGIDPLTLSDRGLAAWLRAQVSDPAEQKRRHAERELSVAVAAIEDRERGEKLAIRAIVEREHVEAQRKKTATDEYCRRASLTADDYRQVVVDRAYAGPAGKQFRADLDRKAEEDRRQARHRELHDAQRAREAREQLAREAQ
jgi:hypothetical protein